MPKVMMLCNIIAHYRVPVLSKLSEYLGGGMTVLVSTVMEQNREWEVDWGNIQVLVQKNITLTRIAKHPSGFSEDNFVHIPYDTLVYLFSYRPKIVISSELGFRTLQAVLYRIIFYNSRLIIHADLSERTEMGRGRRERFRAWLLKWADAVIVNGKSGGRYISKLGVPLNNIYDVPYTTNIMPYLDLERSYRTSNRRILYVGRLIELKGIIQFLSSLCRWCEKNPEYKVEFKLVGSGPLIDALRNYDTPKNLSIKLYGEVRYENLPPFFKEADFFVLPSFAETWGVVINEAMASALPILGSRYSQAVEELVEEGKTGWLFFPDQPLNMDRAINRALIASNEQLYIMGNNARKKATSINPDYVAKCMMQVIYNVT